MSYIFNSIKSEFYDKNRIEETSDFIYEVFFLAGVQYIKKLHLS